MSQHSQFLHDADRVSHDETHRKKLLKVIHSYHNAVDAMRQGQFRDWQSSRAVAATIKDYTLSHLPELLEEFEQKITARGAKVFWASSVAEAQEYFLSVIKEHNATKIVKSKSMITEELEINDFLEARGIEVWESDLGELIVQLAGEKPYHIVTPAMHKTKEEISKIFQAKLGAPATTDAEVLTMTARAHLREAYLTADIGVSGANFLIAECGAVAITENEGNGRLTVSCPPVHVVFAGIEKVLPKLEHLELFWPLLATSGTGQQITSYNSLIRGPKRRAEIDGPTEMHVVLVDNGRSNIYCHPKVKEALRCIRCGACLNACPVYKTIGGHSYGTPYQGPIGAVITPHLRGLRAWNHLSYASSLCGACTDVCPVKIPLHHMLLENRAETNHLRLSSPLWTIAIQAWASVMKRRSVLRVVRPLLRAVTAVIHGFQATAAPRMPAKSFSELWREKK